MLNVSHRTLKFFSAFVWYTGAIILTIKGFTLLIEADTLKPENEWHTRLVIFLGLLFGTLKAKLIFFKSCKRNLERIDLLEQPKVWNFFRPWFFFFLFLMIITGVTLSKMAHNNYHFLLSVSILDLSIATALTGSSYIFWTHKSSVK